MREKRRLFFKGGVQAEITGLGRERFFNIAARRELFVTGIGTDRDGHVLFWTTGEDYKKMKPAARKAGVRLFLRKKYGLPIFLFRNRTFLLRTFSKGTLPGENFSACASLGSAWNFSVVYIQVSCLQKLPSGLEQFIEHIIQILGTSAPVLRLRFQTFQKNLVHFF